MTVPALDYTGDLRLVKVAREVAIELTPLDEVLARFNISMEEWDNLREHPRFNELLRSEIEAWQGAVNTHERVKLKAAAAIEEWLPEGYARMHDPTENLNHKVELVKLLARLAGMGLTGANIDEGSSRFSVTINLGTDRNGDAQTIKLEKDVTPKVIEHVE